MNVLNIHQVAVVTDFFLVQMQSPLAVAPPWLSVAKRDCCWPGNVATVSHAKLWVLHLGGMSCKCMLTKSIAHQLLRLSWKHQQIVVVITWRMLLLPVALPAWMLSIWCDRVKQRSDRVKQRMKIAGSSVVVQSIL